VGPAWAVLPSQADYFQSVKGGGHGDYRMLVMAPASVQEAVEMVMMAFPLSEKYRNPVMILGDGLIGQMMEPVSFPEDRKTEALNNDGWATSGMDRRKSKSRNLVKSLYLNPDELNAHNLKLKAKYEKMAEEDVRYDSYNTDSDYEALIVSYGTMSRVCRTAIDNLKDEGVEVGLIRPQTLFPFPEKAVFDAASIKSCKRVYSIEMNMGQMLEDVRLSVNGCRPVKWYGKCGGEVPTPEDVMAAVSESK
jgi:2-oxoglutarate ferredoxin oxidoreductase subunit alpha